MAQIRKYAALPDLDESQDVFETPELTDDASTLQTSTARSSSPTSETSDTEAASSISRSKLQPDQARSHFLSSRVDAREADFSDRVSSKRRAYHVSSRQRGHADDEQGEDWDSEDEDEGLQRKLARLAREMQEVQSELDKRKEANDTHQPDQDVSNKIDQLSHALDQMRHSQSAHVRLTNQLSNKPPQQQQPPLVPAQTPRHDAASEPQDTQALSKVADFDARLASLERQLGVTTLDTPQAPTLNTFTPILPALSLLDRQLALLTSSASQPHIDALAQKLQTQQPQNGTVSTDTETPALSPEDMAKLRSLYALLPTMTSLAPTLPPLLARLRSLRTLHANAATASQTLDEIERRQDEADKEIREWREGLVKVQDAVTRAENGMKDNATAVEGWVKDLEERVKKLG